MKGHSEIVKLLLVAGATNKVEHYTRKFHYISSELDTDESLSMMRIITVIYI